MALNREKKKPHSTIASKFKLSTSDGSAEKGYGKLGMTYLRRKSLKLHNLVSLALIIKRGNDLTPLKDIICQNKERIKLKGGMHSTYIRELDGILF